MSILNSHLSQTVHFAMKLNLISSCALIYRYTLSIVSHHTYSQFAVDEDGVSRRKREHTDWSGSHRVGLEVDHGEVVGSVDNSLAISGTPAMKHQCVIIICGFEKKNPLTCQKGGLCQPVILHENERPMGHWRFADMKACHKMSTYYASLVQTVSSYLKSLLTGSQMSAT